MKHTSTLALSILTLSFGCGKSNFSGNSASQTKPSQNVYTADGSISGFQPQDRNGDGKIDPPTPEMIAQLQKTCQAASGKLKTVSQAAHYAERKDCKWRTNPSDTSNPNLERKDGYNQASEMSSVALELPEGVICDIALRSPAAAQLHYDDFLVLNLNKNVLFASNGGLTEYLEKSINSFAWDWARIAGKKIQNFEASAYCIGDKKDCTLPGHDASGPVDIQLKSASLAPIALTLVNQKTTSLDLIATGDNDDEDCYHSALDLTVEISYLSKE